MRGAGVHPPGWWMPYGPPGVRQTGDPEDIGMKSNRITCRHPMFTVNGWAWASGSPDYDYGAVQLKNPLGNTVGWFRRNVSSL